MIGTRQVDERTRLVPRWLVEVGLAIGLGLILGVAASAANSPLYAVAALVGLIGAFVVVTNADRGLIALIGVVTLLPYAVIPVPLGGVRLTFLDACLTFLLVFWLLRLLGQREGLRTSPLDGFLLLLIGLAVTSYIFGTAHASRGDVTRLFLKLINSTLFFFTIGHLVRTWRQVNLVMSALVLGIGAAAALGIVLYLMPTATSSQLLSSLAPLGYPSTDVLRYIARTTTLRATSTSVDPNVFGALLLIGGTLATNESLSGRGVVRRFSLPIAGVILACLLLTFSRGSWAGFAAGIAVLALVRYRRIWLAAIPAVLAAFLGVLPVEQFTAHLISGAQFRDQAAAMRLGEYKDAFRLISEYPVFGVGFGGTPTSDLYLGVSSVYLLVAEQMGLLGLTAYLLVLGCIIRTGIVLYRTSTDEQVRSRVLGLLAAITGALVAGIFDHHYFDIRFPHVAALFWLLVGLLFVVRRLENERLHPETAERFPVDRRGPLNAVERPARG